MLNTTAPPARWWALWLIRSVFRARGCQAYWWKRTSTTTSSIPLTSLVSVFFFPLSPKLSPEILVLLLQGTSEYNSLPTQFCALLPPLLISDKQARHREVTRWFCFAAYTELAMSTVKQSQAIPFTGPYSLLVCHLRNLTGKTYLRMCTEWTITSQFSVQIFKIQSRFWSIRAGHSSFPLSLVWSLHHTDCGGLLSQVTWKSWMEPRRTPWRSLKISLWSTRSAWCCWRWAVRPAAVVPLQTGSVPVLSRLMSNHRHLCDKL